MSDWEAKPSRTNKRRRSSGSSQNAPVKTHKTSGLKALIVDNGAYTVKVGHSSDESPKVIPNCIMKAKSERKRLFVGQQIEECRDCSGLYFLMPCERGYITRWEVQKPVWDHVFSKNVCPVDESPVVVTQPLFNFKSIQDCMDEIFFEEYEVASLFRCIPADLAYLSYAKDHKLTKSIACLVVDTGFSFTHVIPYIRGNKFAKGIRRLNVGGKLLTNHLKDIISYRQYNVMEETFVINQVKEDTCYVCDDVKKELTEAAKPYKSNSIVRNYVLPDFNTIRRGYIQEPNNEVQNELEDNCQILRLNNERFLVPEILFHPSDIGMKSMGIAEAVVKSILSCPNEHRESLAKNIILVGGNCKFPGFKERMYNELRSFLPDTWQIKLYLAEDPITYPWKGGSALLKTHDFRSNLVTKQDYDELGSAIIQERFNCFMLDCNEPQQEDDKNKNSEVFQYLPRLKSASIFGKVDVNPNNENEPVKEDIEDNASRGESSSGGSSSGNGEKDEGSGSTEDSSQDAVPIADSTGMKKVGKAAKSKVAEEEFTCDLEEESTEIDLTQVKELFPFGTQSYL